MNVLALPRYGRLGASSRLRMLQYVAPLRALGVRVRTAPLLRDDYLERRYRGEPTGWRGVAAGRAPVCGWSARGGESATAPCW